MMYLLSDINFYSFTLWQLSWLHKGSLTQKRGALQSSSVFLMKKWLRGQLVNPGAFGGPLVYTTGVCDSIPDKQRLHVGVVVLGDVEAAGQRE